MMVGVGGAGGTVTSATARYKHRSMLDAASPADEGPRQSGLIHHAVPSPPQQEISTGRSQATCGFGVAHTAHAQTLMSPLL
jgi:hypothetical protein